MNQEQMLKATGSHGGSLVQPCINAPESKNGDAGIYWNEYKTLHTGIRWKDSHVAELIQDSNLRSKCVDAEFIDLKNFTIPAPTGNDGQILVLGSRHELKWINGKSSRPGLARVQKDYSITEDTPSIVMYEGADVGRIFLPSMMEPNKIFRVLSRGKNGVIIRSPNRLTAKNPMNGRVYISQELMVAPGGFMEVWVDKEFQWHVNFASGVDYTT